MSLYVRFSPFGELNHENQNLHSLHSSNSSCSDGVQWIWTIMGVCAITTREQISAYAGLLSILTWIMVGIPQIIKNFRNIDGMAGVSFLLLFQWTAGDSTNLTGAILTNQLKPQIYLAVYFVMSDFVLLLQYLFFYIRTKRRRNENDRDAMSSILFLFDCAGMLGILAIAGASRAVLCVMGLVSFTHCMTGVLSPSTFGGGSRIQAAPTGHLSRVLLSGDSQNSLLFSSEADTDISSGSFVDLTSSQRATPTFWTDTRDIIGYVIGCISSVFYVGSRIAQLLKNYNSKSTEGLALLMFVLAVFGNIFYGAQILIQDLHKEFVLEHTPWIVGSLGVVFLDCALLWQFYHYSQVSRRQDETRQSLLHHEDCTINSDSSALSSHSPASGLTDSLY